MTIATSPSTDAGRDDAERQLVVRQLDLLFQDHQPSSADPADLLGAQFDAGLAFVHFPKGAGGLGVRPGLQPLVDERLRAAGVEGSFGRNPIGIGMAAPTLATYGSGDQQQRYLRPLFQGKEIWCQLFSEPGAGSDVSGLSTRAERDGDEWVVNGQKVWTSLAHLARYGLLLARTNPDVPKHRGLSYFVLDMHAPGVEIRPLRQMTGDAEFNEIYLTDVRIPDAERLGDVGDGWRVALTTLMNERTALGGSGLPSGAGPIAEVLHSWDAYRASARAGSPLDTVLRDRVAQAWISAEVLRMLNLRAAERRAKGNPGPEGSLGKLYSAELNKALSDLCIDLDGPAGVLYGSYQMVRDAVRRRDVDHARAFLRARANTIEGGTSEIMRNILGERVLGLPPDVRVDKTLPWSQIPRS